LKNAVKADEIRLKHKVRSVASSLLSAKKAMMAGFYIENVALCPFSNSAIASHRSFPSATLNSGAAFLFLSLTGSLLFSPLLSRLIVYDNSNSFAK